MENVIVSMKDVWKKYKLGKTTIEALRGISLQITEGEFMAIMGPSGSGKTTLLNLIACIDFPTEGEINISGRNINDSTDREKSYFRNQYIGYVFQHFNLIPILTVYENVEYPLLMVKNTPIKERVDITFEEFREALTKAVTSFAVSNNVVIVGHAAACILREYPGTLHIKVEAPFADRVKVYAEKTGVSLSEAERQLRKIDEKEKEF
jgi:ABC-type methionine transport system ATPase subunit